MSHHQRTRQPDSAAKLMPASLAYDHNLVPLRMLAGKLIVAATEPLSDNTREILRFILNQNVHAVIRSAKFIAQRQSELYDSIKPTDPVDLNVTWYWPHWHRYDGNELTVMCSGWADRLHWSGRAAFAADHPDFDMWCWIVSVRQFHRLLDEKELPGIRRIWQRYQARRKRQ